MKTKLIIALSVSTGYSPDNTFLEGEVSGGVVSDQDLRVHVETFGADKLIQAIDNLRSKVLQAGLSAKRSKYYGIKCRN